MLTRYGFTSVFDNASMWENTRRLRDRIESGEVPGPRIRSTGEGLVPPGAAPSEQVLNIMGVMKTPLPEIADAAQAVTVSKKLLDEGVDGIKLFASSPRSASLSESAIQAAVSEAHRLGKPVFVHPNSGADVLTALRGGVDVIAHTTPHSGPWVRGDEREESTPARWGSETTRAVRRLLGKDNRAARARASPAVHDGLLQLRAEISQQSAGNDQPIDLTCSLEEVIDLRIAHPFLEEELSRVAERPHQLDCFLRDSRDDFARLHFKHSGVEI